MSYANRDQPAAETSGEGTTRHRWTATNPPTATVVESVAKRSNLDATELPPLYDAIDPDALDDIFDQRADRTPGSDPCVVFRYGGFEVTVEHDGWLLVSDEPELR